MILLGALVGIVSTVLLVGAFFAGRARGYKTGYAKGLADTAYLYDAASGQARAAGGAPALDVVQLQRPGEGVAVRV